MGCETRLSWALIVHESRRIPVFDRLGVLDQKQWCTALDNRLAATKAIKTSHRVRSPTPVPAVGDLICQARTLLAATIEPPTR
jgi:hypothetical protein